jgi:hypothetical protein
MPNLKLLDAVANLHPIPVQRLQLIEPEYQFMAQLPSGQVGTVMQVYEAEKPRYLIEFADLQGCEYAMAILDVDEILALHYELQAAV